MNLNNQFKLIAIATAALLFAIAWTAKSQTYATSVIGYSYDGKSNLAYGASVGYVDKSKWGVSADYIGWSGYNSFVVTPSYKFTFGDFGVKLGLGVGADVSYIPTYIDKLVHHIGIDGYHYGDIYNGGLVTAIYHNIFDWNSGIIEQDLKVREPAYEVDDGLTAILSVSATYDKGMLTSSLDLKYIPTRNGVVLTLGAGVSF